MRPDVDPRPPATSRGWWLEGLSVLVVALAAAVWLDPLQLGHRLKVERARRDMRVIADAVARFDADCGRFPYLDEQLCEPPANLPGWGPEPYLREVPLDPWGCPYYFQVERLPPGWPTRGVIVVVCMGSEGMPGGVDDQEDLAWVLAVPAR